MEDFEDHNSLHISPVAHYIIINWKENIKWAYLGLNKKNIISTISTIPTFIWDQQAPSRMLTRVPADQPIPKNEAPVMQAKVQSKVESSKKKKQEIPGRKVGKLL